MQVHSYSHNDKTAAIPLMVDIAFGDEWNGREPRTRIIAIGAHDGVDRALLNEVFDRCHSSLTDCL